VGEVTEGILRPHARDRRAALDRLMAIVLAVFDRYPVPAQIGAAAWSQEREELARRLDLIGIHAVKMAKDIPTAYAERYVSLMPIHEKLRTAEGPTIHNYMRVTLINVHDELSARIDAPTVAGALTAAAA
jgi:hypothetical protein